MIYEKPHVINQQVVITDMSESIHSRVTNRRCLRSVEVLIKTLLLSRANSRKVRPRIIIISSQFAAVRTEPDHMLGEGTLERLEAPTACLTQKWFVFRSER